ncbi:MAG: hypothetical protein JWP97_6499 [Labilithrix sp.]|nr:hypothetical protein [Labilithrix sp.]
MQHLEPGVGAEGLANLIAPFTRETLERMTATVCVVSADLRIAYVNPAWISFALANGASAALDGCGLDASILSVVPDSLRPFHEALLAQAARTGAVVEHDYECSSPSTRRIFRMAIHPCASGALVVVHSLTQETGHGDGSSPDDATYRDTRGLILQCANCRRVLRPLAGSDPQWDWVSAYVQRLPPRTSHGLCEPCSEFYYPPLG